MTTITEEEKHFGWIPSPPDYRDFTLESVRPDLLATAVPAAVARLPHMPPIGDQGNLGSCVAWAVTRAFRHAQRKLGLPDYDGAELATYWWARAYQGWQGQDTGSYLRDGVKALGEFGNPLETTWPYVISKFTERPSQAAHQSGAEHQAIRYIAVPNDQQQIKTVIANGYPVVFGMTVYSNYGQGFADGVWPMPAGRVEGGHAMALCGYDDAVQRYICDNSWGTGVGKAGIFEIPYGYIAQNGSDLWFLDQVEGEVVPPTPPEPQPPAPPAPTNERDLRMGAGGAMTYMSAKGWAPRDLEAQYKAAIRRFAAEM